MKQQKKWLAIFVGAAFIGLALILSANGTAFAAAKFVIKLGHGAEPTEPTHKAAQFMAGKVGERTQGQVEIQIFSSSQLGSERDMLESCKMNAVQIVYSSPGSVGVFQSEVEIFNGPFLWKNWGEAKRVMRGSFGQKIHEKMRQQNGMRVLDPNWYWGWRHLTTRNTAVKVPADMKGLKVRAPNIPIFMEMVKAMGASPTPINFAEVYTALQSGVVDGQENPIPTIWAKKFFEVQKYMILTGHMLQSNYVVVNESFFRSLPENFQKILQEETLAAGEYASKAQQEEEGKLVANIKGAGVAVIEDVDREAFRKATEGVYAKFEGKWGKTLYSDLRQAILSGK
jgi:tripartite ATP-independent transporter DctP family solute receptor